MEVKVQISDVDRRLLERVCKITNEDTGVDDYNWVEVDTLLAILDSLEDSYKDLEIEYEAYKTNVEENYKPIGDGDNYRFYSHTIEKLKETCNKQYQFIVKEGLKEKYDEYNG